MKCFSIKAVPSFAPIPSTSIAPLLTKCSISLTNCAEHAALVQYNAASPTFLEVIPPQLGHSEGISNFMYDQSDEEREHMLKLVKFVNERGGHAHISELNAPNVTFNSFQEMFQKLLEHEVFVSESINELVHISLQEKDYATHNFLQWYVAEQIEEEAVARTILDKINMIGDDKGGLYLFDRDIQQLTVSSAAQTPGPGI